MMTKENVGAYKILSVGRYKRCINGTATGEKTEVERFDTFENGMTLIGFSGSPLV